MAQPTPYTRTYNLSDEQSDNSLQPISGAHLDTEFDNVAITLDQVIENMAMIQRDDGALANESVTLAALNSDTRALISAGEVRGTWVTTTTYAVGDLVENSAAAYFCLVAHTAGTFATDLAASKWVALTGVTIADGAVTAAKIAADAVTTAKILDGNVTAAKLGTSAVTSVKINAGAVTADKIGAGAVTEVKIADGAVTANKIPDGTIDTAHIVDNNVTLGKIAPIAAGTVLANITAASTNPVAVPYASLLDAMLGNTQGTIAFRGAAAWTVLAPGTARYALATGGAGADPAYAHPGWELIENQTLSGAASEIISAAINSVYTDIKVIVTGKVVTDNVSLYMRLAPASGALDTGNNYAYAWQGISTGGSAPSALNATDNVPLAAGVDSTNSKRFFAEVNIPDCKNAGDIGGFLSVKYFDNSSRHTAILGTFGWVGGGDRVGKVSVYPSSGNLAAGTRMQVWGCRP